MGRENKMIKAIRILEVPIFLLTISFFCFENESNGMGSFLLIVSLLRLWANSITDSTIYKQRK